MPFLRTSFRLCLALLSVAGSAAAPLDEGITEAVEVRLLLVVVTLSGELPKSVAVS